MEVAVLALAGSATALATGLGAVPVFLLGPRAVRLRPFLWGTAVGLMGVASIVGLLLPALDEGGRSSVAAGLAAGVLFLLASRRLLAGRDVHVGALSGAGVRRSLLVFGVLLVHSLPEGFAIGTAFASRHRGPGPVRRARDRTSKRARGHLGCDPDAERRLRAAEQQFWAAVLTSAPQPVGAVAAYLAVEQIDGLLPFSFAFAAGAMLSLIASSWRLRRSPAAGAWPPRGAPSPAPL